MPSRRVTITTHNGAHARPVAELVRLAQAHPAPVLLRTTSGAEVDLSSVLAVMDSALASGDEVVLETPRDADGVLDQMAAVLDPAS